VNITIPLFEEQHAEPKDAKPSVGLAMSQTLLRQIKLLPNQCTAPLRPRFPASRTARGNRNSKGTWCP